MFDIYINYIHYGVRCFMKDYVLTKFSRTHTHIYIYMHAEVSSCVCIKNELLLCILVYRASRNDLNTLTSAVESSLRSFAEPITSNAWQDNVISAIELDFVPPPFVYGAQVQNMPEWINHSFTPIPCCWTGTIQYQLAATTTHAVKFMDSCLVAALQISHNSIS